MKISPTILVLDGGATDKTQTVVRAIRALGVFSLLCPVKQAIKKIEQINPELVIFVQDTVEISSDILEKISLMLKADNLILPEKYNNNNTAQLFWLTDDIDKNLLSSLNCFLEEKQIERTFQVKVVIKKLIEKIKEKVKNEKVLLALSGGVDSSVCAALVNKAIGKNLLSFLVDHGFMRFNEVNDILDLLKDNLNINITVVEAESLFLTQLTNITDPEQKRKLIGKLFIDIFEEEAKKYKDFSFLAQGTIYSDVIESFKSAKGGAAIKSHHNVGGLPEKMNLKLLEPLRYFYKDEIRVLGLELGLPENLVFRQPFPGPGLGVRCVGEITKEKLDILRKADFIFREEIENATLKALPWQYFAIILPVKSVGIYDHARNYGYTCVLRAIESLDATRAEPSNLPFELLDKISKRILSQEKKITRVLYDISAKPSATIEWE